MKASMKSTISLLFLTIMITLAYQNSEAPAPHADVGLDYVKLSDHVASMTGKPHPIGSPANKEVRDYIVHQLESMGLTTEIHKATVVDRYFSSSSSSQSLVANVENIIARLPGTNVSSDQNPSDLLLMAHYDSRENALGAGDDISGTASLLEVARIMSQEPAPVHDVVFLITDGEEVGVMGAQAFFRQHPAAKRVGLVLNFEARGSSGASSLFETSSNNAWLIENIKKAIPDLMGDSLTYEVYRRMPNDTDMSISKAEGIAGLNFAFAKNLIDYHAMTDSSENLDKNSLAQQAYYALSATRYFANLDQWQTSETDRTYFDTGISQGVSYTQATARILGFIVLVLGIGIFALALRRQMLSWRSLGLGSLALVTVLLFTFTVFQIVAAYATSFRASYYPENAGIFHLVSLGEWPLLAYFTFTLGGLLWFDQALKRGLSRRDVLLPALVLALVVLATGTWLLSVLMLLIAVPCLLLLKRSSSRADLWSASIILWWLLTLLVVLSAPNASYVFVWPLASILLAIAVQMKMQFPAGSGGRFLLVLVAGFIPLLLLSPLLIAIYVLIGSTAPQAAMVLCTLCLVLGWPLVRQIGALSEQKTSWLLLGVGLVSMLILITVRNYDARHPLGEEVFYAVDVAQGEDFWVSGDIQQDNWLDLFFGEEPGEFDYQAVIPGYDAVASSVPASKLPITPGRLELISDSSSPGDNLRELTLHLESPVGADYINLLLPADAAIQSLAGNGQVIDVPVQYSDSGWWRIRWYGLPEQGAELILTMDKGTALSVKLVEVKHELPEGAPIRPGNSMPKPYTWSDSTVIFQTLTIE